MVLAIVSILAVAFLLCAVKFRDSYQTVLYQNQILESDKAELQILLDESNEAFNRLSKLSHNH